MLAELLAVVDGALTDLDTGQIDTARARLQQLAEAVRPRRCSTFCAISATSFAICGRRYATPRRGRHHGRKRTPTSS
jgi:hypothetical protein